MIKEPSTAMPAKKKATSANAYDQASKIKVREQVLSQAIKALTSTNDADELIVRDELIKTFELFITQIGKVFYLDEIEPAARDELEVWLNFHESRKGNRQPWDLKVLYLCGPKPLNDLNVLIEHGINIHNVWAVTAGKDYQEAVKQITEEGYPLKIHDGSLAEFFEHFNEVFDIIYFDACGPFLGGNPKTLPPLITILEKQRLASKGALITNYSEPPNGEDQCERYANLATAYFHSRYNDLPEVVSSSNLDPAIFCADTDQLKEFSISNLEPIYSDLITRLTIDLAMLIVPNRKAYVMPEFRRKHASKDKALTQLLEDQLSWKPGAKLPGDIILSPSSYPILTFVQKLKEYDRNDSVYKLLAEPSYKGKSFEYCIAASALASAVLEGNWEAISPEMLKAIQSGWFDRKARLTCDAPMPHLIINSLVGVYGRPYFYNPKQSLRFKYTANVNTMYCDLMIFDQCRSYFDWFPTIDACPSRFESAPFQIVARAILDRIHWTCHRNTANPFRYAAIEGRGDSECAIPLDIPERIEIA